MSYVHEKWLSEPQIRALGFISSVLHSIDDGGDAYDEADRPRWPWTLPTVYATVHEVLQLR